MGTTKKTVRKTRTRRTMSKAEKLRRVYEQLMPLAEEFADRMASLTAGDLLTQEDQSFALSARRLVKLLTQNDKTFIAAVLRHRNDSGEFEKPLTEVTGAPSVALSFKETIRRTPAWKKECLEVAKELSVAMGDQWDEKVYEASVLDTYEPKTSISVQIEESA
jgi:hypothetical protein